MPFGVDWGTESTERESVGFDAKGENIARSRDVNGVKSRDTEDVKVKKCVRKGAVSRGDNTVDVKYIKGLEDISSSHTSIECVDCQCADDFDSDVRVDLHENVPEFEGARSRYDNKEPVDCANASSTVTDETIPKEHVGEYEESLGMISVKGRFAEHIFWEEVVKAPSYILDIIRHGYVIPFLKVPPSFYQPNQNSALSNHDFVDEA